MTFKSASLKLTLFYVLIVMAISLSFSYALFNISSKEIGRGLGKQVTVLRDMPMSGSNIMFGKPFADLDRIRTEQIEESNDRLTTNLVYFNLLILLLSTGASYFLARKTLAPIEEMVEAQNRFTADASHELRTPLTAMKSEIEVNLRDRNLNTEDATSLLKSNLEEIGKLETLSNALLKLARLEARERDSFRPIALDDVLAEAYGKVEGLASNKNIEISRDNLGSATLKVWGDKPALVELIVILLENAIKYSPDKSKIGIITNTESRSLSILYDIPEQVKNWFLGSKIIKQKDCAIITVKDEGVGIKASDIPFIFNRFYRADTSRSKEKIEGYGLGLSIAKAIVELHKGSISVVSKPGKGSQFSISLPLVT